MSDSFVSVVIADDEPAVRDALRELLEESGMRVVGEAENGAQAVELVRRLRPDVAILDLRMGGIDGLEAASRIGRMGLDTQVIMLTGEDDPSLRRAATEIGVYRYLVKGALATSVVESVQQAARSAASPPEG